MVAARSYWTGAEVLLSSTIRSILENPRYTEYAFFGRWTKHETLLDPDDVAAGHVTRFRRSNPDRIVRFRHPRTPQS
jgi:hypothetical protein